MRDYGHLLSPEDRYDPDDDDPILEPPSLDIIQQFHHAARTSSAALETFLFSSNPSIAPYDTLLLAYSIDQSGKNFLHHAAAVGDVRIFHLINRLFPDRHGRRPQYIIDLMEKLPRQRDVDGNLPLHIAAASDNLDFAIAILEYHAWGYVGGGQFNRFDVLGTRRWYLGREEIRYIIPLLEFRNEAGRTAAEEAWSAGAERTGMWLGGYWKFLVDDEEEEEEGEGGEVGG